MTYGFLGCLYSTLGALYNVVPATPVSGGPSLDFSVADDSMYLVFI